MSHKTCAQKIYIKGKIIMVYKNRQIRTMVNYQNGKIYKLVNNVDDEIYIGSTATTLRQRKNGHKGKATKFPERHVYKHIAEVGWENVPPLVLIEECPCDNKAQLHARERYWIDTLKPSLNKNMPLRTSKEFNQTQYRKDQMKSYRHKYKAYDEARYKSVRLIRVICECGASSLTCNLTRHCKTKAHQQYKKIYDFIHS